MEKYCFILGKNPLLSLAEIFHVAEILECDLHVSDLTSELLIVESDSVVPEQWQRRLGGTVKIAQIVRQFLSINQVFEYLTAPLLLELFFHQLREKKVTFGFSLYGTRSHNNLDFNTLGLKLKKDLRSQGVRSRFVESKEGALTTVQVTKNSIIESGAEIIIAGGLNALYIGKTITVQEFEDYSGRDYGRPRRNAKSGMLPPKLAKILINLSKPHFESTILDPFCGSGTIVQEALLMGYNRIIGSDISERAISDSKENMRWLAVRYQLGTLSVQYYQNDVRNLASQLPAQSIDQIVTEPFLGPPLTVNVKVDKILTIIKELETLYLASFRAFRQLLKPDGTAVVVFPLVKTSSSIYTLNILEELDRSGFMRINPVPDQISLFTKVGPTARGSLIYYRTDQVVQREVFIFQRKKS